MNYDERLTASEQRLLYWLSWAALAGAGLIACCVAWNLWQVQGRVEMLYRGKTQFLPLGTRALLWVPAIFFALIPLAAVAGCVRVQTRLRSRVVATLFHVFVMMIGFGCFLVARELVMLTVFRQAWGT